MYAMQYEITLPADYDMGIIRNRVATRGHLLDDFAGLGLKAYLMRERGVDGSPVNQYAPFYLWHAVDGMNRFLWGGGGFQGIVADFGRPSVLNWTGVALERGPANATVPRAASRHTEPLPAGADPVGAVERALAELADHAVGAGVHSAALAINPQHWELTRFTLWENESPATEEKRYQVLHLSTPQLADLPAGRAW
ncbi:DUF4865 family protein [Solihabitans fulvus]|uniref:DUF4865 family protein n=2 Tax=Solihabitans fulvus TaxID=1892852 RepID=A0A5B2XFI6_9PSEU|nr:DUF4865 family protein [Solihabitans fulvus]